MSAILSTYEVRVQIKIGSSFYSHYLGMYIRNEVTKMYHILARTKEQAVKKAEKHGRCMSVRKADPTMMYGNIENLELNQAPYQGGNPYRGNPYQNANPYSGDSPYGYKNEIERQNRNKRINNQHKDKKGIDITD